MPDRRPDVAIVMRTHDRPVLLRRALADVCAQRHQNWRLLVVDDGGRPAEVDRLIGGCPGLGGRVTVLRNEDTRGRAVAWNQGVAASDSRYVVVHDDDDTWDPAFLTRTVAHLDHTGGAAVAVRTEVVWEHVDGDRVTEQGRETFMPDLRAITLYDLIRTNRVVPISLLYRRSVHDDIGPVREDLPVVEDWEFNLRLAAAHAIDFLDGEPLAFWHQRREAVGALANSVIGLQTRHRVEDLRVRDEALHEHVRRYGLGAVLYYTKYFQTEFDHVHARFRVGEDLTREVLAVLAHQCEELRRQSEELRRQSELLRGQDVRMTDLERTLATATLFSWARDRYRRVRASDTLHLARLRS